MEETSWGKNGSMTRVNIIVAEEISAVAQLEIADLQFPSLE